MVPVRMTERPSVSPATANSVPKGDDQGGDGRADHQHAIDEADERSESECRQDPDGGWRMEVSGHDRDGHRSGRDHRPDRDVEFSGDHQQSDRDRDDPERGGDVKPARGTRHGDEVVAAENREEDEDGHEAEERACFGSPQETTKRQASGLIGHEMSRGVARASRDAPRPALAADRIMSDPRTGLGPNTSSETGLPVAGLCPGQRRVDVRRIDNARSGENRSRSDFQSIVRIGVRKRHRQEAL